MVNAWDRLCVSDKCSHMPQLSQAVSGRLALYKNIAHFPEVPAHIGLTTSIAGKEKEQKEDTESHKIDELYEFSTNSSLD